MRNNGFEKYSFHFARYNIPFYALPFVNFFIIDEMGVTQDDQLLLTALQCLKKTPSYKAKAIAYWLRDLEMEKYNLIFVKNDLTYLESLTVLNDKMIDKLIGDPSDRNKMKTGIQEMKEFQFYYSATASLLQELGMERYSQLFSLHGISIDVLPFLNESLLLEMGITESSDRKKILNAINKIKNEIPLSTCSPYDSPSNKKMDNRHSFLQKESPSKSTKEKDSNFESRSVRELLSFINQTQQSPKSKSHETHKTSQSNKIDANKSTRSPRVNDPKKNLNNTNNNSNTIISPSKKKNKKRKKKTNKTNSNSPSQTEIEKIINPNPEQKKNEKEGLLEDEFSDDELDPELKKQLDREVEEFRRRLESVNSHGTKSKLAPIFYLPN